MDNQQSREATNVIPQRIADMLAKYPPFTMLPPADVLELGRTARVVALAAGEILWQQGAVPAGDIYFLTKGRVEYILEKDNETELIDIRDVGDLLGLNATQENKAYAVTAQVVEDTLFYVIRHEALEGLLNAHDAARYYVRRHLFWSSRVGQQISLPGGSTPSSEGNLLRAHFDSTHVIRPRPLARLLTCGPEDTIYEAASRMSLKRMPSIVVVDENRHPLGVVTSADLIKYSLVGNVAVTTNVEKIMASPVFTVASGSSAMAAMLLMLRRRVGQVCVTEDGTVDTPLQDVFTHKDFLAQSGHHPAGLMREIQAARSTARLRELCDEFEELASTYLEPGLSAMFVAQVIAELHDEVLIRLVEMVIEELQATGFSLPAVDWSWIAVGSEGRREQILRTDLDNAFIFKSAGSDEADEENRKAFLKLTHRVIEALVECGFSRCQGGIMASNPRWCKSDREWLSEIASENIYSGDRLLRLIALFDMRPVAGRHELAESVRRELFQVFRKNLHLRSRMAEACVSTPPPLSFWRNFVVVKKGSAEGKFDIKSRGLNPMRDCVRLYALEHNLTSVYSTDGRLKELKRVAPRFAEIAELVSQSYDYMFLLRVMTGLHRNDSGRYIEPGALNKMQRTALTNAFDVQRMLQRIVRMDFSVDRNIR